MFLDFLSVSSLFFSVLIGLNKQILILEDGVERGKRRYLSQEENHRIVVSDTPFVSFDWSAPQNNRKGKTRIRNGS